ncbi:MAG: hypothetical protein U0271_35815 [Polyangiaceae bacterium]
MTLEIPVEVDDGEIVIQCKDPKRGVPTFLHALLFEGANTPSTVKGSSPSIISTASKRDGWRVIGPARSLDEVTKIAFVELKERFSNGCSGYEGGANWLQAGYDHEVTVYDRASGKKVAEKRFILEWKYEGCPPVVYLQPGQNMPDEFYEPQSAEETAWLRAQL